MDAPRDDRRLEELFHTALDMGAAERARFVASIAAGEPALGAELAALLDADRGAHTVDLQRGVLPGPGALPERIGSFTVVGVLGEGGMGTVVRAEQLEPLRRTVAIKLLRPGLGGTAALARFESERRVLARMEHPGIARILEVGSVDGRPWLAMELVDGAPITRFCDDAGLDLDARLRLFAEVCRAVEHAHRRGVVHRDLKPSNILVHVSDDHPVPKVIDFGIAKAFAGDDDTALDLTRDARALLGTPEYLSPEQVLHGTTAVDTRSDVWALGVVLYELVTGRRPFRTAAGAGPRTGLALLDAIAGADPERPSRAAADPAFGRRLRGDLDAVVLRALEKEPDRRYPSPSALADDLGRFLDDEPVVARRPSRRERLARTWRRHRTALVAGGLAVVGLLGALAVTSSLWGLASRRLDDVRRMADVQIVDTLVDDAERALWPAIPETIPAFEGWLARFADVRGRLPLHRAALGGLAADDAFDANEQAWIRATLAALVERVESIDAAGGLRDDVVGRLARAREVAALVAAEDVAWSDALAAIADPARCPRYAGARIVRQPGLVPLGRNDASGLFEFWHVPSGARPAWSPDGTFTVRPEDGLILVLVPGGRVPLGCARQPPGEPAVHFADPRAGHVEEPVHSLALDRYLIGKFEVTQAQWERWTGVNPSRFKPGVVVQRGVVGPTNPVEQVSWNDCQEPLRRLGLVLPTEAQWERACRADVRTAFWCGTTAAELMAVGANIADAGAARGPSAPAWTFEPDCDDGHTVHAPVGSFPPNPFGLHDVHGNVEELCRDDFVRYTEPARDGDGLRVAPAGTVVGRPVRGGSFYRDASFARSSARFEVEAAHRVAYRGLRVALPLVRAR